MTINQNLKMIKILFKTLLISILLFTAGCGLFIEPMPKSWNWGLKPRPLTGVRGFPETDSSYGEGFKSGCESAWQASTKGLTDIIKNRINPTLMTRDPDYANGWWDGYEQCTYIVDWDVT
jgi:hypothetical protein